MTKEDLTSDKINFLVWQYLLESDYRETASKLQKEWNIEDPTQLEFAPHVKHHSLVAVLHRGLLYHESERISAQARQGGAVVSLSGFFGPVVPLSPPVVKEDDYENARKRQVDQRQYQAQNGSPTKRPRLSNGYENGFESLPMDVDEPPNGNGHAYPSPKEVEQPPTPIVTNGPEQGTQVDKVTELSSETTFLILSDNPMSDKPVLLHCAWNPRDPSILAAAGSDALARLWNISRVAIVSDAEDHVNGIAPPYLDLIDNNTAPNSTVGALCWTSDGNAVALASDSADEDSARITIWGVDGSLKQSCGGFEPPITFLQWNPSNKLLLALMPEDEGTTITIFQPSTQAIVVHPLPPNQSVEHSFDATWINDQDFVICGGDILSTFRWDGKISLTNKFETREDHGLVNVTYDKCSQLLATSSETGIIDIWDESGNRYPITAHRGQITSLAWQPIPNQSQLDNAERLLASSGDDGIISLWNVRSEGKAKCSMTMDSSVVALAFTPDGAFLAGATSHQILIWKLEDVSIPRARWVRGPEPGWLSPKANGSAIEEDQHCLSWDAPGQKLAYGVNSQLAVIKWRPLGETTH